MSIIEKTEGLNCQMLTLKKYRMRDFLGVNCRRKYPRSIRRQIMLFVKGRIDNG